MDIFINFKHLISKVIVTSGFLCVFISMFLIDHLGLWIGINNLPEFASYEFVKKVIDGFNSYSIVDILVCFVTYMLIYYVKGFSNRIDKYILIISFLFASGYVVAEYFINQNGGGDTCFLNLQFGLPLLIFKLFLLGMCIVGFTIFFYYLLCSLLNYFKINLKPLEIGAINGDNCEKDFFIHITAFIFLCWLPWILVNYPGTEIGDSTDQLRQFLGYTQINSHHPPFSTFVMGSLFCLGKAIGNANFGYFLYILFQSIVGALIIAYGVYLLNSKGNLLRSYCYIIIAFFTLIPIWGINVQWYNKDLLYTELYTAFSIILIEVVIDKELSKYQAILLGLSGLLVALLRNNGIYVILPTIIILSFYVKRSKKLVLGILIFMCIIYFSIVNIVYPVLGIQKGFIKEALSIPFQQTARYVVYYGEEVTSYEENIIDSVLDYEKLSEIYNPIISDPVKATYKGDNSKLKEYFVVWFRMFFKHPGVYVASFLNGSYGYYAPVRSENSQNAYLSNDISPQLAEIGIHRVLPIWLSKVFSGLYNISMVLPIFRFLSTPGFYSWVIMFCILILLRRKLYGAIIIFLPDIISIFVCMASPLAEGARYELPVMMAAPFLVGWTYVVCMGNNN